MKLEAGLIKKVLIFRTAKPFKKGGIRKDKKISSLRLAGNVALCIGTFGLNTAVFMKRQRVTVYYNGHVQGVGFRYSVKALTAGFEVMGTVRNLLDGRVELVAEGDREELVAFLEAIRDSEVSSFIRDEKVTWTDATGGLRGFQITG